MSESFIQMESVQVNRAGRQVLTIPSLTLPLNQVTVLLGDNGAGKSTFLLAAAGLIDLEAGKISLFGKPYHKGHAPAPRRLRQQLAIVLQDPYLFRTNTRANIIHGLKICGVPKSEWQKRTNWAISILGIDELAHRNARELSGGERKLVALARALALRPKGLLLDEVTASLDEYARDRVLLAISQMVEQLGMSIVMATHIHSLAQSLGAQSVRIDAGRISLSEQSPRTKDTKPHPFQLLSNPG